MSQLAFLLRLFCCLMLVTFAHAQNTVFPSRTVRIVVPYLAGGAADTSARIIGQKLSDLWGRSVLIENRPGGGGNIGTEFAAKAAPDGHTFLMGTLANTVNVVLYSKLPYDILRDFSALTLIGVSPNMLVVHPSLPVRTIKELITLARARPGDLTFGSAGMGSLSHMSGELFNIMAKLRILHIPYKGGPQAITDLIGGQITMYFSSFPSAQVHVGSGRLRAIAVTSARRSKVAPELPTISEAALAGYDLVNWYGALAPAGTPREIANRLHDDIVKVLGMPDTQKQLGEQSIEIIASSQVEFTRFLETDIARFTEVARKGNIKAN